MTPLEHPTDNGEELVDAAMNAQIQQKKTFGAIFHQQSQRLKPRPHVPRKTNRSELRHGAD
jgi:hypothetical protein